MNLEAKTRLQSSKLIAEQDKVIEQKKEQIKHIRETMPSKENKTSMTPRQKINNEKQINQLENQILDRKAKEETK